MGHMVFYRFLFAIVAFLPVLVRSRPTFNRREWRLLLVSAFFGVPLQFLLQFKGLSLTTVAHASLMVGTMPVLLAGAAAVLFHERLDWIGWCALAASTAGACMIAVGGTHGAGGASLKGDLLVVISLALALVWVVSNMRLMEHHPALSVTAWTMAIGFLMLAAWTPVQYGWPPVHGVSWTAWGALAASGVLCTAASTSLWNWGLTQVPASQAGVFLNMEPVIGSVLGMAVFGDHLGAVAAVGGCLIVGSAVLITTRSKSADAPSSRALAILPE